MTALEVAGLIVAGLVVALVVGLFVAWKLIGTTTGTHHSQDDIWYRLGVITGDWTARLMCHVTDRWERLVGQPAEPPALPCHCAETSPRNCPAHHDDWTKPSAGETTETWMLGNGASHAEAARYRRQARNRT
jgi:hypothetical protein